MVMHQIDEWTARVLRAGPFPEAASQDVQDVWIAVSALESRIAGLHRSAGTRGGEDVVTAEDRDEISRLAARTAVLAAALTR